jgi:hypothetical protein
MRFFYQRVTLLPLPVVEQELDTILGDFADRLGLTLTPTTDPMVFGLAPEPHLPVAPFPKNKKRRTAPKRAVTLRPGDNSPLLKSRLHLGISPHPQGTEISCAGNIDLLGILRAAFDDPETPQMKRQMFLKRYPAKAKLYARRMVEIRTLELMLTIAFKSQVPSLLDSMFDDFEAQHLRGGPKHLAAG